MYRNRIVSIIGQTLLSAQEVVTRDPPLFSVNIVSEAIAAMPALPKKEENLEMLRNQVRRSFMMLLLCKFAPCYPPHHCSCLQTTREEAHSTLSS